jgi:uncharacterized membrane-anchored protein
MRVLVLAVALVVGGVVSARGQEGPQIPWEKCPCEGQLGSVALVSVPEGFAFVGKDGVKQFMEATENPVSGSELGAILKTTGNESWFVVFSFSNIGYVKDDEKDKLDANAILTSIREGTEESNNERRERGWPTVEVTGWQRAPFYDTATNNLTWATNARSNNDTGVNYSVRLLGRYGVMNVDLVVSPQTLPAAVAEFNGLLQNFTFRSGNRYAEFRSGDKVATYGLTALIAGGVGAAAMKSGLLPKIWKGLVLGLIALAGAIKRFFASLTGRKSESAEAAQNP